MRKGMGAMILAAMIAIATMPALAEDAFYRIPLTQLKFKEGRLPSREENMRRMRFGFDAVQPSGMLDSPGEIYITRSFNATPGSRNDYMNLFAPASYVASIRTPEAKELTGQILWPEPQGKGLLRLKFTASATASTSETRRQFFAAKAGHYAELSTQGVAGAAWFRHQAAAARAEASETTASRQQDMMRMMGMGRPRRAGELEDTFELFSGSRAVSENLQLDRTFNVPGTGPETVDIASIPGISTQAMDWAKLTAGLTPRIDALAELVPADQHAIFFPSFQAMIDLMDEARRGGTPILRLLEDRSENAKTRERYERQLCLATDALGRMVGPAVVASVAFTGSDPYLRAGSDVAVLFKAVDVKVLAPLIAARQELERQGNPEAKPVKGEVAGIAWQGVCSPDRTVCSYMAVINEAIVVTNSRYQLERIVATAQGKTQALATQKEYAFFRDRYKLGEADETGLVVLSDAAIRRWCGPRWRIGDSRRTRAAAALAELQARHLDELAQGKVPPSEKLPGAGEITWTKDGPASSIYGTLAFMTPIGELTMEKATNTEADAYGRFRDSYQQNWRYFFDPIAIRLSVKPGRLATDLTVMPLIVQSDFRHFIDVALKSSIEPGAGDPHPEAWLHLALAIDKNSEPIRQAGLAMTQMRGPAGQNVPTVNPFGWLGSTIAIYADEDPFWGELMSAEKRENFMEQNFKRIPVGVCAEVTDGLKLAIFLTTLRGMIEQTAPGMTNWSNSTYKNQAYVKIAMREPARGNMGTSETERLAIYYATTPRALVISPNEKLVQRALDRLTSSSQATAREEWLGKQLAFRTRRRGVELFQAMMGDDYQKTMQRRAWSNLPILNEWRRRYPDRSPMEFHERFWQTRLVGPGESGYVWNEQWQTMESKVYGHPGEPKTGPVTMPEPLDQARGVNLGVTFENDGLRGRAEIERENLAGTDGRK